MPGAIGLGVMRPAAATQLRRHHHEGEALDLAVFEQRPTFPRRPTQLRLSRSSGRVLSACVDMGGGLAVLIGSWLRRRPRIRAAQPRVEGLAYLGLAVWTGSSS